MRLLPWACGSCPWGRLRRRVLHAPPAHPPPPPLRPRRLPARGSGPSRQWLRWRPPSPRPRPRRLGQGSHVERRVAANAGEQGGRCPGCAGPRSHARSTEEVLAPSWLRVTTDRDRAAGARQCFPVFLGVKRWECLQSRDCRSCRQNLLSKFCWAKLSGAPLRVHPVGAGPGMQRAERGWRTPLAAWSAVVGSLQRMLLRASGHSTPESAGHQGRPGAERGAGQRTGAFARVLPALPAPCFGAGKAGFRRAYCRHVPSPRSGCERRPRPRGPR